MMRSIKLILITAFVIAAVLGGGFVLDAYFIAPGPDAQAVVFTVEQGESVKTVSRKLADQKLIKSRFGFESFVRLSGTANRIQAGEFTLKTGMSYVSIVETLTSAAAHEVQITIPEGYTAKQIGETVRAAIPSLTEEEWMQATEGAAIPSVTEEEWTRATEGMEGYLFPDTYRFNTDATAAKVVATMRVTLDRRLAENDIVITPEFRAHNLTYHEVITLASIVEREVRAPEEMKMVADIFLKRLDVGMALQADSTVNYVTNGNDPSVSADDLKIDSPYNTYKYPGLPPGPISNPGLNAILAVLNPTPNDFYYFLTTPEGDVKYARTFNEHVTNKQKYLR